MWKVAVPKVKVFVMPHLLALAARAKLLPVQHEQVTYTEQVGS